MLNEMYRVFLDSIPWPLWIVTIEGKILFLNKAYQDVYKVYLKDVYKKKYEEIFTKEVAEGYRKDLERCIRTKDVYKSENKVNGRYLEGTLFPVCNGQGKLELVAGIIIDISDRKEKEKEVEKQKDILRTTIDALPQWVFYKDRESRFLGYNKIFEKYYKALGIDSILGKSDLDIYPDKQIAQEFINYDRAVMISKESKSFEQRIEDNGTIRIEESIKIPVLDKAGEVTGIVGISKDITSRKHFEEKLRYLSEIDTLTGLYNRYSFEEKLKIYNKEEYLPLGIILGDVNGLKLINDTLGHFEGDRFIKDIGNVLKSVCGKKGDVFRWGGDEFMVLLPQHDEKMCEQFIDKITNECLKYDEHFIKMSIALGAGVKNTIEEDTYTQIRKIEDKVYRRKLLEKKSMKSSVLQTMKNSLEQKNMETNEHATRLVAYAIGMGKIMGMKRDELDELSLVAQLHDIGKIAVPEELLLKEGKLTPEEFEIIKTHAEKGYRIIIACGELNNVAKSVLTHHERWDGSGYPLALKGEDIPIMARIISIVDAYDVMTSERMYKKAMSKSQAISELQRCAGTQFDADIVKLFIEQILVEGPHVQKDIEE